MNSEIEKLEKNIFFPTLDGIRFISVGFVLFSHWVIYSQLQEFNIWLGSTGVNIFFTLSGFLITRILIIEKETSLSYRNSLKAFYTRRVLRIFPLYYFLILVGLCFNIPNARDAIVSLSTFTQDVPDKKWGFPPAGYFNIYWSLSVEEQFYLSFPLLLGLLPSRYTKSFLIVVLLFGVANRLLVYSLDFSLYHKKWVSNNFILCCLDSIASGSLLAWYFVFRTERLKKTLRNVTIIALSIFLLVGTMVLSLINPYDPVANIFSRFATSFFSVFLIGASIFNNLPNWILRCLNNVFVRYLGKISYGIYLFQAIVPWLIYSLGIGFPISVFVIPLSATIYTIVTIALASVSWYFFEKPINGLKKKYPY